MNTWHTQHKAATYKYKYCHGYIVNKIIVFASDQYNQQNQNDNNCNMKS